MNRSTGDRVKAFRNAKAWTQDELASVSGVGLRTVQRIERGKHASAQTLKAVAAAFDVEVGELETGCTAAQLAELKQSYTCPCCGAPLSERSFVPYEHGEAEFEVFECGCTRGWADRPCPRDPHFPAFEDYDLHFLQGTGGEWSCFAVGRTSYARQVDLRDGHGQNREEAEAWVRHSYIAAKDGSAAAEAYLYEFLQKLPSLSEASRLSMAFWRRPA
jgi:DNA-binding XRE family transcriptional regulator